MLEVHHPHHHADPHDHLPQQLAELVDLLTQRRLLLLVARLHHRLLDLADLRLHACPHHAAQRVAVRHHRAREQHVRLLRDDGVGGDAVVGVLE